MKLEEAEKVVKSRTSSTYSMSATPASTIPAIMPTVERAAIEMAPLVRACDVKTRLKPRSLLL